MVHCNPKPDLKAGNDGHRSRQPRLQHAFSTHSMLSPMNSSLAAPLFAAIEMAPRDPILGLTEAFNADKNPKKINLGVGVYTDDNGKVPLLECVRRAERQLVEQPAARNYLPIDGLAAYDRAVQSL